MCTSPVPDTLHGCPYKKVAHKLGDTKLFAKLIERIMVAVEAVYLRIVLKSCTINTEVATIGNQSDGNNLEMIQCKFTLKLSRHKNKLAFLSLLRSAVKGFSTKLTSYKYMLS